MKYLLFLFIYFLQANVCFCQFINNYKLEINGFNLRTYYADLTEKFGELKTKKIYTNFELQNNLNVKFCLSNKINNTYLLIKGEGADYGSMVTSFEIGSILVNLTQLLNCQNL